MKTNDYKPKPQCLGFFAFMCNNFHLELLFISLLVPHNLISCIEHLSKRDKRDSATKLLATAFILSCFFLVFVANLMKNQFNIKSFCVEAGGKLLWVTLAKIPNLLIFSGGKELVVLMLTIWTCEHKKFNS